MSTAVVGHPSPWVVEGMKAALEERLRLTVLSGTTVEQCVELAATEQPDVAVIDAGLAPGGEVDLCRRVTEAGVRVLMVAASDRTQYLPLLEHGAAGLTLAEDGLDGMLIATRTVLAGHAYLPPHLLGSVLHHLIVERREEEAMTQRVRSLSPREREVLGLLGEGADTRAIAGRLVISPLTAKTHIHRVLAKLEVRSRVEAAAVAAEHDVRAVVLEGAHD